MSNQPKITEAKNAISDLILKHRGVCAVGTGKDELGRDAIVIHIDPRVLDSREHVVKLIGDAAGGVPVVFLESGPYRKLPAS